METPDDQFSDPFEEHFRRDSVKNAPVYAIVFFVGDQELTKAIEASLAEGLARLSRKGRVVVIDADQLEDMSLVFKPLLDSENWPLTLVSKTSEPWTDAHLEPLFTAIEHCDHVVGCRKASVWKARSALGRLPLLELGFRGADCRRPFPLPPPSDGEVECDSAPVEVRLPRYRDPRQGDVSRAVDGRG